MDGIVQLFEHGGPEPTNIGNPGEFTVSRLAETVIDLTGSKSRIEYHELPVDDPKVRCPDISKAKLELGWEPRIQLEDGLKRTIDYCRKALDL